MTYEVKFANTVNRRDFTGSLDETKEEINNITNKAATLVEEFKSMVRDTL